MKHMANFEGAYSYRGRIISIISLGHQQDLAEEKSIWPQSWN